VAAEPLVGEPPLLIGRQPGQLQDVTVQLQLDAALRRAGQPRSDRGHDRAEHLRLGEGDGQRAERRQLHRPGSRWRLAARGQLDGVDVQVEELTAKPQGGLGDLLGVVVGPDGMAVESAPADRGGDEGETRSLTDMVEQPAKVMRIGSMIKQLLEEVKAAPLDEKARQRLTEIHRRSILELETGLAPELVDELDRLSLPFEEGHTPSEAELRMAQAQLVGWLEGLFHGIQATLVAQQMAARMQLEQMRTGRPALTSGPADGPGIPGMPGAHPPGEERGESGRTGQYL